MDILELSKKDIIVSAQQFADQAKDGEIDVIKEIASASKALLYYQTLVSELKDHAIDELYKYNDKEDTTFHGIQFKRTSTPATYSFKDCEEFKILDENLKALKKVLTTATKTGNPQIVDGVIYEPVPISKQSRENVSLTIK